jgi:hypothetical protein
MYGINDKLDLIRTELVRVTDELLENILKSAGISILYVELHPDEFVLEISIFESLNASTKVYKLYHNDALLGTGTVNVNYGTENEIHIKIIF